MSIRVACPACGSLWITADNAAGTVEQCRRCNQAVRVPEVRAATGATAAGPKATASTQSPDPASVPWYRRQGFVGTLVFIGFLISMPIFLVVAQAAAGFHVKFRPIWILTGSPLLVASLIAMTGPVYAKAKRGQTGLQPWSKANRYIAGLLVVLWVAALVYFWLTA